jgi:hypothetical protein
MTAHHDKQEALMGNLEVPKPVWWDDGQDETAPVPTQGGLFGGLPSADIGTSLHLLMDPRDIETIDWGHEPAGGSQGTPPLTIGQVDPDHSVPGRPDGDYLPASGPKNPIGPVQGYPETGKGAWRAGNDDAIVAAAKRYNSTNGYFPGDAEFMTPQLMKSWMMRESGSGTTRHDFETDPFQVNKPGDWPRNSNEKTKYAGLFKGQAMTPETSADAALKWLHPKGTVHAADGSAVEYRGAYEALRKYNAKKGFVDGIPKDVDYANDVLNRAWASYGDWQK